MKTMKTRNALVLAGLVAAVAAGMAMVGCETTTTTDNVLTINPASVTLTNNWETVVFTASYASTNVALALPLEWSVSAPALGTITGSGGLTAIYQGKNVEGNNTITVRDQGDNSGIAVVIHQ
jgi:hypothetical protein